MAQNTTENQPNTTEHNRSDVDQAILPPWRVACVVFSLLVGLFLSLMDTSIVATAIYTITTEFGALGDVTWVILAYTLTYVGFAVIVTRLADVSGRKVAVIVCFVIFIAMSIGCGFAQSLSALIACRAIQGIGGSGLYSLALVTLPEISPLKYWTLVSALIGLTVAVSGVLGPVLGGIITGDTTWRWIFWLNAPVAILPLALFIITCPRQLEGHHIAKRRFRDVDFVGCLLLLTASILLIFGLQEGGIGAYSWSSPVIICTLVFGIVSGIVLVAWENLVWRRHGDKVAMILPIRLLTNRVVMAGVLATLCTGFSLFLIIFNIPLRFQIVNLSSPSQAGIRLVPFLGSSAVGTILGGGLSMRKNHTFPAFVVASCLMMIGVALLSTLSNDINAQAKIYGYEVLVGLGAGISISTISITTTLVVDFQDHSVAQGLMGQARIFGGSIGVAASSAVFNAQLHQKLVGKLSPVQISGLQTSFSSTLKELDTVQLNAIRVVFADSFNQSLRICTYVAAVGVIASLCTWQRHPPDVAERKAEYTAAAERLRAEAFRKSTP